MNAADKDAPEEITPEPEQDSATAVAEGVGEPEEFRLTLNAEITDAGPCRKHVRIRIPREDLEHFYDDELAEFGDTASVPGFRTGHVPKALIAKRFRKELSQQVKQKVLVQSLEQVSEDYNLDPINEPNLDVESIEIPDEGDFEYEFDVEVRPDFDLPDYEGLKIERAVRDVTDEDVDEYLQGYLAQYGSREDVSGAAEADDYISLSAEFKHNDRPLHKIAELNTQIKPTLRFRDAEISGFDTLMIGAKVGDSLETEIEVSRESENLEMRGEKITATLTVKSIKRSQMPELTGEFLERLGFDDEESLRDQIHSVLNRQVEYQQRQSCRKQVLDKITASADWELPEALVLKQVENALRREILEMQQAGFSQQDIRSRENEIRQRAVSTTEQALKEHFVLDKIATKEGIDVSPQEVDVEIELMAMQQGESARRMRSRLEKSGMDENLTAQIRERKAVDFILQNAEFDDVPMEKPAENTVAAVSQSVCGMTSEAGRDEEEETED